MTEIHPISIETKESKSFFIHQWKLFCKTTGVKGFSFLISASRLEKSLWAAAILAGVYLTVADVNTTWMSFSTGETTTKLYLTFEKPMQLRTLSTCIMFNEKNDEKSENFDALSLENRSSVIQIFDFMRKEYEVIQNIIGTNFYRSTVDNDSIHKVKENSISFLNSLAAIIWSDIQLTVEMRSYNSDHVDTWKSDSVETTWFGPSPVENVSIICFQTKKTYNFTDRVTKLYIKFNLNNFLFSQKQIAEYFEPDSLVNPDLENLMMSEIGYSSSFTIRKLGRYRMISHTNSPCSNDNSELNCRLKLASGLVVEQCGCQPLFSAFFRDENSEKMKLCQFADMKLLINKCSQANVSEWRKQCKPPCNRDIYSFFRVNHPIEDNLTELRLSVDSFLYPTLEEIPLMSFRRFLAQLGGNLSLWLGASFIVLLHVITFILKLPYEYYHREFKININAVE